MIQMSDSTKIIDLKRVVLLLLVLISIDITSQNVAKNFKVISYNIWNGFDWGKDENRREKLQQWVNSQQPDVIALQELCAYSPKKLKEDAASWGHKYSVLLKETGYSVGLTSKHPIILKERLLEGLHHGALHCQIQGIEYVVVHFHPGSIAKRRSETKLIIDKLSLIIEDNPNVVVLGDFNAHSPFDADQYDSDGKLLNRYRSRNEDKGLVGNIVNNSFDYSVISSFLAVNLVDVVQKYTSGISERGSFPSRVFESVEEKKNLQQSSDFLERIDYILVSPSLAPRCIDAKVYNRRDNWFLSDHCPVVAVFNLNK